MSNQQEVIKQKIAEARLIDDFFFEVFADDTAACEEILRTILEDDQLKVIDVVVQSSKRNIYGRSVRLDALCTLGDGNKCNVEVQRADNDDHFRRVRFNAASITVKDSKPGEHFDEILDLYMVYISENDFIGGGKTIYHVDKVIRETGGVIDDGVHEVYVNTQIKDGSKISDLMECFISPSLNSKKFPATTKRFTELKETEGGLRAVSVILNELLAEEAKRIRFETLCEMIRHEMPKEKVVEMYSQEEYAEAEAQVFANA